MPTNLRAKPQCLVMGEAVPYGQTYTYHDDKPLSVVLDPEFWLRSRGNLRRGDYIRYQRIMADRVVERADLIVVSVGERAIDVRLDGEPRVLPEERPEPPKDEIPYTGPVYEVKRGYQCFAVVGPGGKEVAEFPSKKEAERAAAELNSGKREAA